MFLLRELPDECSELNARCLALVEQFTADLVANRTTISASQNVFQAPERQGKIYRLVEGNLSYNQEDRRLFFFEAGDLVGFEHFFNTGAAEICTDFAVEVDEYDGRALLASILAEEKRTSAFQEYLITRNALLQVLLCTVMSDEVTPSPEVKAFQSGETIIEQNAPADNVYTLVEGHADVFVDGVKVGEIIADEIFGALAALTTTPRTASVIATERSMVLSLRKENFIELIKTHPMTVLKMVEDMARAMVSLNEQVVKNHVQKR